MSEPSSSSGCYPDKANTLSHALLANLQSRLIRIPLCTVTPLEATLTRFFFLASRHHVVNICTILPLLSMDQAPPTPLPPPPPPPLCPVYHLRLFVFDFDSQSIQ